MVDLSFSFFLLGFFTKLPKKSLTMCFSGVTPWTPWTSRGIFGRGAEPFRGPMGPAAGAAGMPWRGENNGALTRKELGDSTSYGYIINKWGISHDIT